MMILFRYSGPRFGLQAGRNQESLSIDGASCTIAEALSALDARHGGGFVEAGGRMLLLVNGTLANDRNRPLCDGDSVELLSVIAGG